MLEGLVEKVDTSRKKRKTLDLDEVQSLVASLEKLFNAGEEMKAAKLSSLVQPETPSSLPESLETVAHDLQKASSTSKGHSEITQPIAVFCEDVAKELHELAKAASTGSGQGLIVSARSIAALMTQLAKAVKDVAFRYSFELFNGTYFCRCTDLVEQDKLIRSQQALRNFSVQLKILASVNAATSTLNTKEKEKEDNQLVVLTRTIGKLIGDTLFTVSVAEKTLK